MPKPLTILLTTTLVFSLAACGNSRMNPKNWFGEARSRAAAAKEGRNPLIPEKTGGGFGRPEAVDVSSPVGTISSLVVERVPGGAIVRVTGISDYQGAFGVKMIELPRDADAPNVLRYQMLADQPVGPVGNAQSRKIVAAVKLSDQDLEGIRRIEVAGLRNVQSVRR
jgi:hypothetical protein